MNKVIMITGATAGFGWATAIKFAQNGYNIIITGRRKERLNELKKLLETYNIKVLKLLLQKILLMLFIIVPRFHLMFALTIL